VQHGVDEEVVPGDPPPIDGRLVHTGAPGDTRDAPAGDAVLGEFVERRGQHDPAHVFAPSVRHLRSHVRQNNASSLALGRCRVASYCKLSCDRRLPWTPTPSHPSDTTSSTTTSA